MSGIHIDEAEVERKIFRELNKILIPNNGIMYIVFLDYVLISSHYFLSHLYF